MTQWVASGLGFALAHVEASFDRLFRLAGEPREYTEFDTSALLRSAFKDRIAALTSGVQGGLFRLMRRARSRASRRPSTAMSRDCKPNACHCRPPAKSRRRRPLRPPRWLFRSRRGGYPAPKSDAAARLSWPRLSGRRRSRARNSSDDKRSDIHGSHPP